jgi:hypothetical protein
VTAYTACLHLNSIGRRCTRGGLPSRMLVDR